MPTFALLLAACAVNQAPTLSVEPAALTVSTGVERSVQVSALDPDGDEVVLTASVERGSVLVEGDVVSYTAPQEAGDDTLTVRAHDPESVTELQVPVLVGDPWAFGEPEAISATAGNAKSPDIATHDGSVHVAWHDFTQDPSAVHHAVQGEGTWSSTLLELSDDKLIRPRLLSQGETLHLLFDRWIDGDYTLLHARHEAGAWSAPVEVAAGSKASPTLASDDTLHAVYYLDGVPAHAWSDGERWHEGDPVPADAPWINGIRLQLLPNPTGLSLGLLQSYGDQGYDLYVFHWQASEGWAAPEVLYDSPWQGCEEPAGANDPDGEPRWIWAEQDPMDAWTYGIMEQGQLESEPRWITRQEGFSGAPWLVVPPDAVPIATWVDEGGQLWLSRAPYDSTLLLADQGLGPRMAVDDDGFTHMVWYGPDGEGVEQIFYATNRPDWPR